MTNAAFPNSLFNWGADRVDASSVDYANDVNSLAADLTAVESVLGVEPQIEKNPIGGGNPIAYPSVDARISAMQQGVLPWVSLGNTETFVPNVYNCGSGNYYGQWNTYTAAADGDPFGMYNGADITIPVTGWWFVTTAQWWDWWSTGYHRMLFWVDNVFYDHDFWRWDFAGNDYNGWWQIGMGLERPGYTKISWNGILQAGQRIRVLSENGCPDTPHRAYDMLFKAICVQRVPSTAPTG